MRGSLPQLCWLAWWYLSARSHTSACDRVARRQACWWGYVVMTILSQGSCTLMLFRPLFEGVSPEWAEAVGAFYYVLLLAVAGPVSLLATLVATSLDRC